MSDQEFDGEVVIKNGLMEKETKERGRLRRQRQRNYEGKITSDFVALGRKLKEFGAQLPYAGF